MCNTSLPVHNPCVPLSAFIPGGMMPGARLLIRGTMPYAANRFTIDLQCGSRSSYDDIAFHMSIRPSEYTIVRNSFQSFNWGYEERYGSCPINGGQSYDIEIIAEPSSFSVRINGQHFCNFNHRIAMERISHIHIGGETQLYYVGREAMGCSAPPPIAVCPPQVIVQQQPTVVYASQPRRPHGVGALIGAAAVGSVIGAIAGSRPGHHHHHHGHHHRHHGPRW